MKFHNLSPEQKNIIESPPDSRIFLEGPAGTGKTTAGVYRILHLLKKGTGPNSILVILPQHTLAERYRENLQNVKGGRVTITTLSGLARRMVEHFWPMVAEKAGFSNPRGFPVFLSLETAQYYMSRIVKPLLEKGYFQGITIKRNRLYSQILDNLNKSALVGFPYTEIGERLKKAWIGEKSQIRVYEEASTCAGLFRNYCLSHNLIDFSLNMEIFVRYLWHLPLCRDYLVKSYTFIIFDNIEEDTPAAHDILGQWLPYTDSALFIYDSDAGYRRFLGADPTEGLKLKNLFRESFSLTESFVTSIHLRALSIELSKAMNYQAENEKGNPRKALVYETDLRYHNEMLERVTENISCLIKKENVPPEEIVVLSPYLSDSLRFSLMQRLEEKDIPFHSHRPSRPLRDEPAIRTLLTLALLAHPSWKILPSRFDVYYTLIRSLEGLDPVRANLLVVNLYSTKNNKPSLKSFEALPSPMQKRVTYLFGECYENLRLWLQDYIEGPGEEGDNFFCRLFGEVLSQKGYGFHNKVEVGEIVASLIESVKKFLSIWENNKKKDAGKEYIELLQEGLVADQYSKRWDSSMKKALLIAPAYTFLLSNRPVDYQFWLNPGGPGWWERLYQPLTQAYILSRQWTGEEGWTDTHEFNVRREALYRLVKGLIRRCRHKIYLSMSELGEQGYEQQGKLLKVIQQALRNAPTEEDYV